MRPAIVLPVTCLGQTLQVELSPQALELLRGALADEVAPHARTSPFVTPDEAAELLRCRRRRIYELVGDGRLKRHGDGRRLLLRRDEVIALGGS